MSSSVAACGRCGAPNPQDADFCQTCGALLAAYRAPSGAIDSPAYSIPSPEAPTVDSPPNQQASVVSTSHLEPQEMRSANGNTPTSLEEERQRLLSSLQQVAVTESVPTEPENDISLATASLAPEPAPERPETVSSWPKVPVNQPPVTPNAAASINSTPMPEKYRSLSRRGIPTYPGNASSSIRSSRGAQRSSTPHVLIFAGITAFLLAFFIGLSAGSTMSVVLLFLGGPIGFGLIMAGALMLIGRHPTGRP